MQARRALALALLLIAACGEAGEEARVPVPQAAGDAAGPGDGGGDPCEQARALERDCLQRLATACQGDDEAACRRVCNPFLLQVSEACPDAAPDLCDRLAAKVDACFADVAAKCRPIADELEACDARAREVCASMDRRDPQSVLACNDATAACWGPFDELASCRAACLRLADDAIRACGGTP
jgi:hypothetical protein